MAQDFKFTDGDRFGMTVDGGGSEGAPVAVTGDRTVSVVTTAGAEFHGILPEDADDGEKVTIAFRGAPEAAVASGTGSGVFLVPDGNGAFREINTDGATGESVGPRTALSFESESDGTLHVVLD